jgi:protein TonB
MALRCLLFSSDEKSAALICQVLAGLGMEGESCSEGPAAVEKVIQQSFQVVIIDWDMQPEAGLLLTTARERKAAERPLTLAIVSDDASVPKALQAGANSILRKPVLVNQAHDTLKTASDLLRARESAAQAAAASAASSARPAWLEQGGESHLRVGDLLQSGQPAPGAQFVLESDTQRAFQPKVEFAGPLKELEPMAAAVQPKPNAPAPPAVPDEPRGLSWYLNRNAATLPSAPQTVAAAVPAPAKLEFIGYDQMAASTPASGASLAQEPVPAPEAPAEQRPVHEQRTETQLFAYITGGSEESEERVWRRFWPGKKVILGALVLACCAVAIAPQAPWHSGLRSAWARGRQIVHAWLNPQPVVTQQAPSSHEDFGRPGDEYKLPAAENIPDATTDPSQIRVVPVVDPTAKKPNNPGADADQTSAPLEGTATTPGEQTPPSAIQSEGNPAAQPTSSTSAPTTGGTASPGTAATAAAAAAQLRSDAQAAASSPPTTLVAPVLAQPQPPGTLPHTAFTPTTTTAAIPPSLRSDIAAMTPEASGNKPVEAALPSIEPVNIPEADARKLLIDQPTPAYPSSAKGQQGTVVLQVLIGRDGTVQDAKFLQGSLAFARAAIDGVRQWKFKPYMMNGRPVSVEAPLTISFKPAS